MGVLMMIFKILAAIFVFGIIILVHELGHFLMCKLMGVRVNEFAIGMGPKLLSFGKKETAYTLRLFPIGGFCAMEGEDEGAPTPSAIGGNADRAEDDGGEPALPDEEEVPAEPDPRAFPNKKVWRRILIVVAGAAMNLVLGYVLLVAYYGIFTVPDASGKARFSSTIIASLPETAVSYQTGLRPGDEIVKIDGKRTVTDSDIVMIMQSDEDGIMDMTVRRAVDGKKKTVLLKGVQFQLEVGENGKNRLIYDFKVLGIEKTVWSTLVQAGKMEYSVATMIWRSLGDLITGKYGINDLSGPVGTMDIIGDAVAGANTSEGMMTLIMLVVMITVNVGIFNLLPLPALDGGRLIFLLFEGIFRRPVPAKYEGMVHFIGLMLLLLLMVVVTFSDIWKIVAG
ncbi:M50 family metallopeptidase [Anaeromassilibacillus sp. SJQ-5]